MEQKNYTKDHENANKHVDEARLTNDLNVDFDNYNSSTFSQFKFDSHVPLNIQKLFIHLCSYSKCALKLKQLKKFEQGSKYSSELQTLWFSLCPAYSLFKEKPECLSHLQTDDISSKQFSASERRKLLEKDLTKCVHLGDESHVKDQQINEKSSPILHFDDLIAAKHYYITENFVKRIDLPGSINKNWEQLANALKGNYTKSDVNKEEEDLLFNQMDFLSKDILQWKVKKIRENMNLEKQYEYVLENYNDIPLVPSLPHFSYYLYSISVAYCRKHLFEWW
ncbi:hypothetical protein ABK040_008037 [Willaertia magna]